MLNCGIQDRVITKVHLQHDWARRYENVSIFYFHTNTWCLTASNMGTSRRVVVRQHKYQQRAGNGRKQGDSYSKQQPTRSPFRRPSWGVRALMLDAPMTGNGSGVLDRSFWVVNNNGMVWDGMGWDGIWFGIWYDMIYETIYGMVWYIWYMIMIWYDTIYDMIWYMMRCDAMRYDTIRIQAPMLQYI